MIRVFIIAPAITFRAGLKTLLSDAEQVQIVGESHHIEDVAWEMPDVVIWAPMPTITAGEVEEGISNIPQGESAALLIIHDDSRLVDTLMRMKTRAWGIVPTESTPAELLAALDAIYEGLVVIDPGYLESVPAGVLSQDEGTDDLVEPLTGRETEILQFLALGLTNKQIALRLGISAHTVKFHVSSIFSKLQTSNRAETVKLGMKKGLIVL